MNVQLFSQTDQKMGCVVKSYVLHFTYIFYDVTQTSNWIYICNCLGVRDLLALKRLVIGHLSNCNRIWNNVTYVFIVNLVSGIAWMSGNSLLKTGAISETSMTSTGLKQGVSSKAILEIQAIKEHRFTLNTYVTC